MNGSNHVTCKDGVYNGTAPNCLPKGKKYFHFYRLDEFNNSTARTNCVDPILWLSGENKRCLGDPVIRMYRN